MARRPQGAGGSPHNPSLNRMRTTPIPVTRTTRRIPTRCLTSMPAGKMVPLAVWPLLRQDAMQGSTINISLEMMETAEILVNAVNVRVMAYLVPNLAFERFNGIDQLNRSYMKEPETEGGTVVPFFQSSAAPAHGASEILTYLGKHFREGAMINDAYVAAYNAIWNFRAKNRSPDISERLATDNTLAPAFWNHQLFAHIVPDFDQAIIDGEVPLNVVDAKMPVKGLGYNAVGTPAGPVGIQEAGGGPLSNYPYGFLMQSAQENIAVGQAKMGFKATAASGGIDIWAELQENGITVSLSNIELARKTQAFAALRKQYTGHDDDYIIDLLMQGIEVPEQLWRQPMLIADRQNVFGMNKRYASDSADLTASVVNGASFIGMTLRTPVVPTGGVVMIVAEVTPEQLFERQQDPYLHTTDQATLPDFLRDTLDPEKVEVVENQWVDVDHATPNGTFGYAPLNYKWNHQSVNIGGKFYRPEVDDPFLEDRMRLWSVETANPTLSADFYLCTNIHTKVFVVTDQDPFEAVVRGDVSITGNTVFGHLLIEASDDYNAILDEVDTDRIDKPVTTEADAEAKPAT